jgi:hypothetical protein
MGYHRSCRLDVDVSASRISRSEGKVETTPMLSEQCETGASLESELVF